jgi:mono/diheme cytochrome c family protein
MSAPSNPDPRIDQAAASDVSLLAAHEKLLGKQPDDKANYRILPLNLLFFFSGLIFFGGTYLNLYSGKFDPRVYDENGRPPKAGGETAKIDPIAQGKKLFNNAACNTCHQPTGLGLPGVYPPLAGSEWVTHDERVIRIVLYGLQGHVTVKGTEFPGTAPMPSFGQVPGSGFNWTDAKISYVLSYVRSEWGNSSPIITPEQVEAIHKKEGDHKGAGGTTAWTQDELLKLP